MGCAGAGEYWLVGGGGMVPGPLVGTLGGLIFLQEGFHTMRVCHAIGHRIRSCIPFCVHVQTADCFVVSSSLVFGRVVVTVMVPGMFLLD